ncbi:MAG: hypothetical protein A3D13_09260 [Planctomycetes bacterium RIFCSPHIGHO2_02_FULL_40_12]|nr:MAG: hypothetical protein A3D13_09260 [Planctomycetes bacterium RIFCSPHIGHO2_02_FULL_40_12]
METTLNNQKVSSNTSSAFALRVMDVDRITLTPAKNILKLEQFEILDEWEGYVRFSFENFLEQDQPEVEKRFVLPQRLTDPLFGHEELNQRLQEMATAAPSIEQVWEITKKLPSLSKLLSEERDNE